MKIRFRKSVKIMPGVRVNFSKSGVSTSIGKRGAMVNISKRGTRITAGIPGTGLSASKLYRNPAKPHQAKPTSKDEWIMSLIMLAIIFGFIAYFSDTIRPLAIVLCALSLAGLYFLIKKPKPQVIPKNDIPQQVMNKPKSTTTWQERADAVGALVKPSSSAHDNQTKQSTTTTSEGLVTQAELQALVNGKPTYHYADQKHDLDVMLACVNAEIENYWKQPSGQRLCAAPFYFERAAILYRKAKLYADEIRICETWISIIKDYSNQGNDLAAKVNLGPSSQGILKRLPKARELLKKHQDQ